MVAVAAIGALVLTACGSNTSTASSSQSAAESAASSQSAAQSSAAQQKIFVFGYFPRDFNGVTQGWSDGVDKAAATLGSGFEVVMKYEGTLDVDPGSYMTYIQTAMVEDPNGVVVIPNNSSAMTQGLTQLQQQYPDVKFVIMDQPVPDFEPVAFVGTDNEKAGAQAAGWLIEQFNAGSLPSGKVAILRNAPGSTSTDARLKGFLDAIAGTGLEVVKTVQPADQKASTSARAMADVLLANPDLGGVFSVSDVFGLGAADAIVKADSKAKQVSMDASVDGVKAILAGKGMDAEVAQHLIEMGNTSVLTAAEALQGKTVPPVIDTGTTLVTSENAEEFLASPS